MKIKAAQHIENEFESLAEEMLSTGRTIAETKGEMFIILDDSPEYHKRANDPSCSIFCAFTYRDRVFYLSFD